MKVKDLIEQEIDIDVYDDVCEELGIAFCGPLFLSEQGEKRFADVLEYPVSFYFDDEVIVHIDDDDEKVWKKRLRKAKEFFYAAAGYCPEEDYCRWFREGD